MSGLGRCHHFLLAGESFAAGMMSGFAKKFHPNTDGFFTDTLFHEEISPAP
ncbi:MAG: hypothetical protein WDN06_10050 [Asticcacaulis sp.]